MTKAYKAEEQEQKALRPTFSNAYDYYTDYYSEKEEKTFYVIDDSWANLCRSNDSSKKLTHTDIKLVSLIRALIKDDPKGCAYLSLDYLCTKLDITDRQLRTVRNNINHIFLSKWRKCTKINGALKRKVYVFTYTLQGRELLGLSAKAAISAKFGKVLPTSIKKDENEYINNRSSKSTSCKNSNASIIPLKQPKPIYNKRKKPTNAEIKTNRAKFYRFNQYQEAKSLGDHYPLTTEECLELQKRSGREFSLNAMNEILLDMSRKPNLQGRRFVSKAQFMAYMATVFTYEKRDAVKTANSDFKILSRATKPEIIAYTSQNQRDDFMATFEEAAINTPTPENRFKAKLACTLPPMIGYNLLSNLRTVCKVGEILKLHMSRDVVLTEYSVERILNEANAVGGYDGVEKLEFITLPLSTYS